MKTNYDLGKFCGANWEINIFPLSTLRLAVTNVSCQLLAVKN